MIMCVGHSAYSSCSQCYNYLYLYILCLCLELTKSVSVGLLCSQLPLGLIDLTAHILCHSFVSCV